MFVGFFGALYNNMACYIILLCAPILIWKLDLKYLFKYIDNSSFEKRKGVYRDGNL